MPEAFGEGVGGPFGLPFPDHSSAVAPPKSTSLAELGSPLGPRIVVNVCPHLRLSQSQKPISTTWLQHDPASTKPQTIHCNSHTIFINVPWTWIVSNQRKLPYSWGRQDYVVKTRRCRCRCLALFHNFLEIFIALFEMRYCIF